MDQEQRIEQLQAELAALAGRYTDCAGRLGKQRRSAARKLVRVPSSSSGKR